MIGSGFFQRAQGAHLVNALALRRRRRQAGRSSPEQIPVPPRPAFRFFRKVADPVMTGVSLIKYAILIEHLNLNRPRPFAIRT